MERCLLKNWKGFFLAPLLLDAGANAPPYDNNHVAHAPLLVYLGTTQMAITMMLTQVIDNDDNN